MTGPDLRITLVGEANPYRFEPEFALYPLPAHASGGRLAHLLGLSARDYLRAFQRVNLCPREWSLREAKVRALEVRRRPSPLVLLGAKVCSAFEVPFRVFSAAEVPAAWLAPGVERNWYAVLPHPSGLSRAWNDPEAPKRARETLARLSALASGAEAP